MKPRQQLYIKEMARVQNPAAKVVSIYEQASLLNARHNGRKFPSSCPLPLITGPKTSFI